MSAPARVHVDSNVLLRYLTGDPPELAEKAARLFRRVQERAVVLVLEEIILAETVWVLQSFYRHAPRDISKRLMQLLLDEGIDAPARDLLLNALLLYADSRVRFGDALLAAHMADVGADAVFSFDEHFDRIPGLRRLEPGETVC